MSKGGGGSGSGGGKVMGNVPVGPLGPGGLGLGVAVAVDGAGGGGAVTARQAGGLIDLRLRVSPLASPLPVALQNIAKAVNIAFQTNYGENMLETVYQAAIVKRDEVVVVHREYFGYGTGWFSMFGMFIKTLQLTMRGPDPASPEFQKLLEHKRPGSIRGLLDLVGRKLDIVPEYEDRVPYYVEQMFDRLEASGIIVGWSREEWTIRTTRVGLNIRIAPSEYALGVLREREELEKRARTAANDAPPEPAPASDAPPAANA